MSFNIEDLNKLSDVVLEDADESLLLDWVEPPEYPPLPQPGKHVFAIDGIRDLTERTGGVLSANLDFRIVGEPDGGRVSFQRLSSKLYERRGGGRTSQLLDMVMAAQAISNVPKSARAWGETLCAMREREARFGGQLSWRGFCNTCYGAKLLELTGASTVEEAKARANDDQKAEAGKAGAKAESERDFPENGHSGKQDHFPCPTCGTEIRAQGRIRRFFKLA